MAAEITDDSAPVPETCTSTTLGGGSGNGSSEGFMQMLQQIQETLMDINKTLKTQESLGNVESSASEGIASPLRDAVNSGDCDKLLELANEVPVQQLRQASVGTGSYERSALHVAVMKGSEKLVETLLTKMQAYDSPRFGGTRSPSRNFVYREDGFGLTALDMAAITGNRKIIQLFENAEALKTVDARIPDSSESLEWVVERRRLLRPILNQPFDPESGSATWIDDLRLTRGYEYCLHHAAQYQNWRFVKYVCESGHLSVLEPLLRFRDADGRTPLHTGLDSFGSGKPFLENFLEPVMTHFLRFDLNVTDYMGRTPLHYAAAQGQSAVVTWLAACGETDLNATFTSICNWVDEPEYGNPNFTRLPVEDVTALHLAVIHNHEKVVEALLEVRRDGPSQLMVNAVCHPAIQGSFWRTRFQKGRFWCTPLQLAAYMGRDQILEVLLKDERVFDLGVKNKKGDGLQTFFGDIPALHLATSQFHTSAVKALVDSKVIDAFVKDERGNMALHIAARMAKEESKKNLYASIQHHVSILHFQSKYPNQYLQDPQTYDTQYQPPKPSDNDIITCIDILMQTGLDMQHKNKMGTIPKLSSSCSQKVRKWWLKKMAIEAQENKNSLTIAANAISVTAALVATASFVGPLQPPLGLLNDGSSTWLIGYSQVRHTSVEVFLFCDSLSFYLAIAAIVFAMLPSWQIPHEGLAQEVRIAQRCVKVAVLLLFASIIFIVCAFSAASIAIIPEARWRYKALTVISISIGALVSSFILSLSFMRLLTLIASRSKWARKISDAANSILLWDGSSQ